MKLSTKLIYLTIPRKLGIKPWDTRKHVDAIFTMEIHLEIPSAVTFVLHKKMLMQPQFRNPQQNSAWMPAPPP